MHDITNKSKVYHTDMFNYNEYQHLELYSKISQNLWKYIDLNKITILYEEL